MQQKGRSWRDAVVEALAALGGKASLSQINQEVKTNPLNIEAFQKNHTWEATIRRTLQSYKIFQSVERGVWMLQLEENPEPRPEHFDIQDESINHDKAQGMLVALGNIYGYQTYVPVEDQSKREFQGRKLANWVTIRNCEEVFDSKNIANVRNIDVLWFSSDQEGLYPSYAFEVEHSTDISSGIMRLSAIPERLSTVLYIIADERKRSRFNNLISQTHIWKLRSKYRFQNYVSLESLFNLATQHYDAQKQFLTDK